MTQRTQQFAQFLKVIDFTIKGKLVTAACRSHRLMTLRRKIDNGKATMAQSDSRFRITPHSFIVRPPVRKDIRHHAETLRHDRAIISCSNESYDATHRVNQMKIGKGLSNAIWVT